MTLSIKATTSEARQRYLEQIAELQQRNQEKLASGRRIARAADDAAGLAIAKRLEAAVQRRRTGRPQPRRRTQPRAHRRRGPADQPGRHRHACAN